jgi:hypothetical protein
LGEPAAPEQLEIPFLPPAVGSSGAAHDTARRELLLKRTDAVEARHNLSPASPVATLRQVECRAGRLLASQRASDHGPVLRSAAPTRIRRVRTRAIAIASAPSARARVQGAGILRATALA